MLRVCGASREHVRIVPVAPHDPVRCDHLAIDDVIGDVEEARDKRLVTGDTVFKDFVTTACRHPLGKETALGAGRYDDRIFYDLGLHQPEHFGTEIFAAIGPTQPAACDVTTA